MSKVIDELVNNFTDLARMSSFSVSDECCCDDYIKVKPKKKQRYNCPNCGAPITGPRCAYCDTLLVEPTYYQYNIPYSGYSLLQWQQCNIRQQLEEAQARTAQNMQTNFILANDTIRPICLYPESGLF